MGGAHSEEPWDVQPQPGDRMEGQGGTRGAKEIVQGPGKVLECWSAIGARVKRRPEVWKAGPPRSLGKQRRISKSVIYGHGSSGLRTPQTAMILQV
jgi:hypothetical protein